MTRCLPIIAVFCLLCGLLLPTAAGEEKDPSKGEGKREKIELFNGKDLTGWEGHEKYWSVKEGVIIGKNTEPVPVSTYLLTKRKFRDFRLVCDFKLAESEMHSGIALWGKVAPDRGDKYTYAGHLVMFPSGYGFYDLYGRNLIHQNADKAKKVGKQHDWNQIEIVAIGERIRFALNGVQISDWREPEPERIKRRRSACNCTRTRCRRRCSSRTLSWKHCRRTS